VDSVRRDTSAIERRLHISRIQRELRFVSRTDERTINQPELRMKHDADLQEIDARLDARAACTRKRAERRAGNEKKNYRERERERVIGGKGGSAHAGDYIMLPMPRERELFVSRLAQQKSEPLPRKRSSSGSRREAPVLSLSLSLSFSL